MVVVSGVDDDDDDDDDDNVSCVDIVSSSCVDDDDSDATFSTTNVVKPSCGNVYVKHNIYACVLTFTLIIYMSECVEVSV